MKKSIFLCADSIKEKRNLVLCIHLKKKRYVIYSPMKGEEDFEKVFLAFLFLIERNDRNDRRMKLCLEQIYQKL